MLKSLHLHHHIHSSSFSFLLFIIFWPEFVSRNLTSLTSIPCSFLSSDFLLNAADGAHCQVIDQKAEGKSCRSIYSSPHHRVIRQWKHPSLMALYWAFSPISTFPNVLVSAATSPAFTGLRNNSFYQC